MKKDIMKGKGKVFIIALAGVLCAALLGGVAMHLYRLVAVEDTPDAFGGETVFAVDFNSPSTVNTSTRYRTTLDYGIVSAKVGSFTEGNGTFIYTIPANSSASSYGSDPYVNFDMGANEVYLNEYSVYMMDFDVKIEKDSGCLLYFNIDYRNSSGSGLSDHTAQLVYSDGKFYLNASIMSEVGMCNGDSFHVTYVVNHEKTLIYIDGKLLVETARSYQDGAEYVAGFRMGMLRCINKPSDFVVSIDNLIINKFAPDYDGNINKLFALPDTLLKKNSDTIFGGSFVWVEE